MSFTKKLPSLFVLGVALSLAGCSGEKDKTIIELEKANVALAARIGELRTEIAEQKGLQKDLDQAKSQLQGTEQQIQQMKAAGDLATEQQQILKGLLDGLKSMIESGELQVRIRRGRMVVALPSAVLFKSGEADLSEKGMETLRSVAAALKQIQGRQFQVAGHTDNVPLGKDNPHGTNWHLSAARAVSVVQFLVKEGVSPRDISAAGYAHYQPVASNKSAKGKAQNRRVEISLMPDLKELPDLSKLEEAFGLKEQAPPPDIGY
jgi:chemotaxis protein MotB